MAKTSGGIGFSGCLFLLFLAFKLTGVIGWSWLWVTAPLWGGIAIFLAVVAVALPTWMLVDSIKLRRNRKLAEEKRKAFLKTAEGSR